MITEKYIKNTLIIITIPLIINIVITLNLKKEIKFIKSDTTDIWYKIMR